MYFKNTFRIAFYICLAAAVFILLFAFCSFSLFSEIENKDNKFIGDFLLGSELLPGIGEIYPSIYYNNKKYYWKELSRNNQPLKSKYKQLGDILFVGELEPYEDLQFTAMFYASGSAYLSIVQPNIIYVRLTTEWFIDTYVIFDQFLFDNFGVFQNQQTILP